MSGRLAALRLHARQRPRIGGPAVAIMHSFGRATPVRLSCQTFNSTQFDSLVAFFQANSIEEVPL